MQRLAIVAITLAAFAVPARSQDVAGEIRRLLTVDSSLSPAAWMSMHPTDSLRAPQFDENVCRVAIGRERIGGAVIRRVAMFDAPPVPRGFALDRDTTRFALRNCRLRIVTVSVTPRDSTRRKRVTDSLATVLRSARVDFGGPPGRVLRQNDEFMMIGWPDAREILSDMDIAQRRQAALLDSMLVISGFSTPLHGAVTAAMAAQHDSIVAPRIDSIVLDAVRRLTAPKQPEAARAAALLAADLLVTTAAGELFLGADSLANARVARRIAAYEQVGAHFWHNEPDAEMVFGHDWRRAAYAADPRSVGGRAALRLALLEGASIDSTTDRLESPRIVIELGERELARHSPDSAMAHLALAQAYADMYVVAHGFYADLVDSTEYARDFPDARQRAIAHGFAALASLRDPRRREQAWLVTFDILTGNTRARALYYPFIND
jgi:hypothetical protein